MVCRIRSAPVSPSTFNVEDHDSALSQGGASRRRTSPGVCHRSGWPSAGCFKQRRSRIVDASPQLSDGWLAVVDKAGIERGSSWVHKLRSFVLQLLPAVSADTQYQLPLSRVSLRHHWRESFRRRTLRPRSVSTTVASSLCLPALTTRLVPFAPERQFAL